jgi:putative N6-adenine-specific DNA methylase
VPVKKRVRPKHAGKRPRSTAPSPARRPGTYGAFAVSAPGLESIVASELVELKAGDVHIVDGGVEFLASLRSLYEVNLQLRTASRVLVRLARFRAMSFAELEKKARTIPWELVLSRGEPVLLRVTCRKSRLYHSDAVAERIARDLAARFDAQATTTATGDDADPETPSPSAQLIVVRFDHDHCTVSADSSGAHLHQRGYRTSVTQAPMRETLAAALVMASGWDRRTPLLDPFCGSGTVPIEAALMAARIAPGRNRDFRFMRWPGFDRAEWARVHAAGAAAEQRIHLPAIRGSDHSVAAIRAAKENSERAGVAGSVDFERQDAEQVTARDGVGWVVSNPPYGVRLGNAREATDVMSRFGAALRQRFGGWHVALLASARLERAAGFPLHAAYRTTNGGLRVQIFTGVVPVNRVRAGD